MKRITLTLAVAGALVVPAMLLTGSAFADNPHGNPADPNGSCGQGNSCNNHQLPQSEGCLHGNAPAQNPHCQPPPTASGLTPAAPVSTPAPTTPTNPPHDVSGTEASKKQANPGTAAAVSGGQIEELPFTGLSTLWLAIIGAGMLAMGLMLRARSSKLAATGMTDADSISRTWDVPELDIAPAERGRGVSLRFSEFDALGRLLVGKGRASVAADRRGAHFVIGE